MEDIDAWKTGISAAAVLVTLLGVGWKIRSDLGLRAGRLRADFDFIKELRSSVGSAEMDSLFKERAYHALIGRDDIPVTAVEYLITLREPSRAINLFHRAHGKLAIASYGRRKQLFYTGLYKNGALRTFFAILSVVGYFIFYLVAASPILLYEFGLASKGAAWSFGVVITVPFFLLAIFTLRWGASIAAAQNLMLLESGLRRRRKRLRMRIFSFFRWRAKRDASTGVVHEQ